MKRILEIGPGPKNSKGGIATVISNIVGDTILLSQFELEVHESYCDGNPLKRILFSIKMFIKFLTLYKKYDIFHIHMASYGSTFRKGCYVRFLKKRNKKVVLHVHGGEYLLFYNNLSINKKNIVNQIWRMADVVIVLSDKWKEIFEPIFKEANIEVVRNGIEINKFNVAVNDISKYKMNFLFLAKICKGKGVYDLIESIQEVCLKFPQIKLFIAGNGEVDEVKKLIEDLNLDNNIEVLGWIDDTEKIELLKMVGTVILPSYNEGLPMTILEGMAAGKVILSTTVGAIPEVINQNKNGILIEPGNVGDLVKSIETILIDDEFNNICALNNLNKAKDDFDIRIMHQKIAKIYNSLF